MADSANLNGPSFIIEGNPSEAGSTASEAFYIEQRIRDNPEAFQTALQRLGETATAGTLQLGAIDTELTTLEQGASGLLTKFFSKRLDLEIEFDEDTEKALRTDKNHKNLIDTHRKIRSVHSQLGPMKHEIVANPAAEPARDAIRRSRIAFFIARTISYQAEHDPVELPSAG